MKAVYNEEVQRPLIGVSPKFMSEKYKIIPNKSEFTSFLETLNASPGELAAVQNIVLVDVDVDSDQGTWTINYQKKNRDLRTELLAAVADKLTAACSLQGVAFLPCEFAPLWTSCVVKKLI